MQLEKINVVILYLAAIMLLGHDLVAHHHDQPVGKEGHFIENHHPGHGNTHEDDEDAPPHSLFSYVQHQLGSEEANYIIAVACNQHQVASLFLLPAIAFHIENVKIPPKILPTTGKGPDNFNSLYPASTSFRGPPSCA